MTTDLPDPHGCPHCGHAGLAERWGETICGMCGAPRVHATPGCPVRNVMAGKSLEQCAPSTTAETARERRVHDGGPRINP